MLKRIGVAARRARSLRPAMHTAPSLAGSRRASGRAPPSESGATARAAEHGNRVSFMGAGHCRLNLRVLCLPSWSGGQPAMRDFADVLSACCAIMQRSLTLFGPVALQAGKKPSREIGCF